MSYKNSIKRVEKSRIKSKGVEMYKVIVDIAPRTIAGTNGCHKYVFGRYCTKKETISVMESINNAEKYIGIATMKKEK